MLLHLINRYTKLDSFHPVIFESSNSSLEIKTGTPVQWKCYVRGMPPPIISWFLVSNID